MSTDIRSFLTDHPYLKVCTMEPHPSIRQIALVPQGTRQAFLQAHFGRRDTLFMRLLSAITQKTLPQHPSTGWVFAETNTGAAFAYPQAKPGATTEVCTIFGDHHTTIPVELAGLIASALVILQMVNSPQRYQLTDDQHDTLVDHYHALIGAGYSIADTSGCREGYFRLVD